MDDALDRLAELSGSDFTSVMLEVERRRAARGVSTDRLATLPAASAGG
jgi:hypothetical protein